VAWVDRFPSTRRNPGFEVSVKPGLAQLDSGLSISPDGRNVYGAGSGGPGQPDIGSLMVLDRLPDGSLTQKPGRAGCFVVSSGGEGCTGRAGSLGEARETTVSPDGRRVYVFNYYDRDAAMFLRQPSGRLTEGPAD
jgi:DNA-binding beta-propeller fold protein YncE